MRLQRQSTSEPKAVQPQRPEESHLESKASPEVSFRALSPIRRGKVPFGDIDCITEGLTTSECPLEQLWRTR